MRRRINNLYGNKLFKSERIVVLVEEPHIQSLAGLILLKEFYTKCDRTNVKAGDWRIWLTFRNRYMRRKKKLGSLVCYICGQRDLNPNFNSPYAKGREATIDHIIPTSKGGSKFDEANFAVACSACNNKKADKIH